jgi:hypothetical protein
VVETGARVALDREREPKGRQAGVIDGPKATDPARLHVCPSAAALVTPIDACHDTPGDTGATMANPGYF